MLPIRNQRVYTGDMPIDFPNVITEPLYYGRRTPIPFDGYRAVVDQNDGSILTVVSEQYQLIRHEQMIEALEMHLRRMNMAFERRITFIKQGAKMLATYTLPEITVQVGDNEILSPTIIMKNSYDLSWVATIMGGVMRLICSNGAYMGTMFQKVKQRHIGVMFKDYMIGRLERLSDSFHDYVNWYKSAIALPLQTTDLNVVSSLNLNKTEVTNLVRMREKTSGLYLDLVPIKNPSSGEDDMVWQADDIGAHRKVDLFNLLTEFTTHKVANGVRQDGIYEKINRGLMY